MKEDKKNIDRLFQEKFRDFEATPSEKNWDQIKDKLTEEKDSRKRIFPIWFKIAGVAAVVISLFMIGSLWFNADQNPAVVNQEETESLEQTQQSISANQTDNQEVENTAEDVEENVKEDNMTSDDAKTTQTLASSNNENLSDELEGKQNDEQITSVSDKSDMQLATTDVSEMKTTSKDEIEKENSNSEIDLLAIINSMEKDKESAWNLEREDVVDGGDLAEETLEEDNELEEAKGKSLFDEIAKQEATEEEEQNQTTLINRFAVRPNVAPIYYNSMKGGSAVDPSLAGNKSEGDVTMSYGVDVSYAVSSRLKVRTGVSRVNMSYSTPDIAYIASPGNQGPKSVSSNPQAKNILVVSESQISDGPSEISGNSAAPYTFGELNQQLEYIEVPVEVEFAVLDKKFGINVIGGASTLILKDDLVRLNSEMGTTNLGRANNLNSLSFTTNIGVGFNYNLTETFNFNVEPTFKYQVNGFSGDNGFKPYFFGVYSGVSMRF